MVRLNCFSFYREEMCRWLSNIGTWMDCKEQPLGDQLFRMLFSMDVQPEKCKQT